ncbi:hypothetical protein EUX98_g4587 [Antrodiella citrinella]|uniref:Uncharacterized protein n=1 Tax=Antrodiella citrinella TaxID=2447956 RepID=A0A4S4N1M1_9APHY|nr:hypothetical protein EUX98_g4587 [Antrodiella citrinella]
MHDAYIDAYDPTLEGEPHPASTHTVTLTTHIHFRSRIDTYRKSVVINSEVIILECLDIGGQEDYTILHERASRTGDGFFLVYSVTSRASLQSIVDFHQLIQVHGKDPKNIPVIILGNKCDLKGEREVSFEEGQQLAGELGCKFYETSAKVGTSVDAAYMDLARQSLIAMRERAAREFSSRARPLGSEGSPSKRLDRCIIA